MNTPKYLEIAELLRIDIFVKHAKENQLNPGIRFKKILYLILDYPHKHYTFKHFEV